MSNGGKSGWRRHLSFANGASALALFVALGGGTAVAVSGRGGERTERAFQSGDLVRGVIGAQHNTGDSVGSIVAYASLPPGALLPRNPGNDIVTVAGEADTAENNCNGSVKKPTAPRGVACIYETFEENAANNRGLVLDSEPRYGFRLAWEPTAANAHTVVEATWAYRIP